MTVTSTTSGPLAGVRVVELVGIGPGPFAAMMLADLGAEVIRVDRPGGGALSVAPAEQDILARGRPSAAIDLKADRGRETVLRLVERADILLEGFRPGVTERLGLGPDDCHARNPRLVYGRMTGWGQDGPLSQRAGHDINYISIAGGLDPIGRAGGPPQVPLNLLGDFGGGAVYLVAGVLAALTHARATGEGQVVDAAITDGVAHLLSMIVSMQQSGGWGQARGTNLLDTGAPFYDVYETSDGRWMSVGGLEPQFWAAMEETLARHGITDLPDRNDPAVWPALRERLAEAFGTKTQEEWTDIFAPTDACVAPVIPLAEAPDHPHNRARGTYVEREGLVQPAPAPRFSATPAALTTPPVRPGENTREALAAWGIDDVDALIADGVAVQN
ncbi:CaiB/BaiF CoA-transferase family protein [Aeromicrobium sp. PE09-221]|uniref:CaiB/BaiF CoA transferase family protein n=1 Tax=Aeromicrobium sp. PE09-221 TaxID=1898043 RepID=UPI001F459E66|nr:CaiB/BaiF CoA-transferase family protein [Aeromicrobium sp. PE09-221]